MTILTIIISSIIEYDEGQFNNYSIQEMANYAEMRYKRSVLPIQTSLEQYGKNALTNTHVSRHQNFKSRSRASSSSSGSGKFLLPETIQFKVSRSLRNKDLFQRLLEDSSIMEQQQRDDSSAFSIINQLNLSPRQHSQAGCKCTKIDCLKLYCQCFAKGKTCNQSCVCVCCRNTMGNEEQINRAKSVVNYRQPNYFKGVPTYVPARKCTCKKSLCQKKYCECYNAGLKCTEDCQCCDCHNGKPDIRLNFDSRMEIQIRA